MTALDLAAIHDRNIDTIISNVNPPLTRKELTKKLLNDPSSIPPQVLKEVYYLDAYTRLVNAENYSPDREYWTAKNYVEALMEPMSVWLEENGAEALEFFLKNEICEDMDEQDEKLFSQILAVAIGRQLTIDDGKQPGKQNLATDGGGSPESDSGHGSST